MNNKKIIFFDGAMGTYYGKIAKDTLSKCELANIYDKDTILKIHKEYINAGCTALRTNTFAANTMSLERDFKIVEEVIKRGYAIALEAASDSDVEIFADIGPVPILEGEELLAEYKAIVDVFLKLGARNFIFETFSTDEYLEEISIYIKDRCKDAYIIVEFAISPEGYTRMGKIGAKLIESIANIETIDACGFNCFSGPYHLYQYIKKNDLVYKIKNKNKHISIMPNSGYPTVINNRTFFDNTKEYFAKEMVEIAKEGVNILGGCCGTTPEFIKESISKIKSYFNDNLQGKLSGNNKDISEENNKKVNEDTREKDISSEKKHYNNDLIEKLNLGKKIVAVELDPPIDTNIDFFMEGAKRLKDIGVDAITIADCPIARARVDSSILACKIKSELDMTPIPHLTCRDRNINATKALLLGLNIQKVNNVLVVTGDPIPSAQRDEIKSMFSFNSAILANYIKSLNETVFSSPFNICAALNVNVRNFDVELKKAKKKMENGVSMFLTQPILTKEALENLKRAREELCDISMNKDISTEAGENGECFKGAKILGGIIPIVSYRNACFMNNEISGIKVSKDIIDLYENIEDKRVAVDLGVKISKTIMKEIEEFVDGYYLITPFKKVDIIERILK